MAVKELSTMIYDQLSEVNIMKFGHTYPIPLAIISFWYHKYEIDGDKILSTPNDLEAQDLLQTIKFSKNLEKLILMEEYEIEALKEIPRTIATHCPKITHLILEETILYEEEILALCECTTLEELTVRSRVGDKTFEALFPCLHKLRNFKVINETLALTGSFLMKLPKTLKGLCLCGVFNMDFDILLKSIELLNLNLLKLEFIQLEYFDNFISALATVAPYVQDLYVCLELEHFNGFGGFKQLTKLEIHFAHSINDIDIKSITENCTLLIELVIYDIMERLTEVAFGYFGNLPNLKTLTIGGIWDRPLSVYRTCMSELSKCAKLETLCIMNCGLTNYAAARIIQECHFLSVFTITKCKVTTTDLIQEVATEFHKQTERTNKLALNLFNNEPGVTIPEEFGFTKHPLLVVTIEQDEPDYSEGDLFEINDEILDINGRNLFE